MGRIRRDAGNYGIFYGISGFSASALEFGYLGALLFLVPIFYLYIINKRFLRRVDDPYWKALSFGLSGIVFTSFVVNFIYSEFYRLDIAAFLLFFFGGIIYKREAHGRLWEVEEPMPSELPPVAFSSPELAPRCDVSSKFHLRTSSQITGK
jgi:hypothetical protein